MLKVVEVIALHLIFVLLWLYAIFIYFLLIFAGHKNIKALESIIRFQKIEYDFGFYQREYESNIEVLCVSEGKSILPVSNLSLSRL